MRSHLALGFVAASLLTGFGVIHAQVPADVRERLLIGEVVVRDAWLYAMATGPLRGSREGSESWLVTRAMRHLGNKLCSFEAVPGRRLEVGIKGVTLVASEIQGKEMTVVIQAPVQKPSCKVTVMASEQSSPGSPSPTEVGRIEEMQIRLVDPSFQRAKDIVIRNFGGEY
jgi:hypothetical protein